MDNVENNGTEQVGMGYVRSKGERILSPADISVGNARLPVRKIGIPTLPDRPGPMKASPQPRDIALTKASRKDELEQEAVEKAEPEKPQSLSDRDVLAHTASLWKYKPVPKDEPEPYREYITESATLGKFHVTAARVRGKKHKHEGTNCDDWFETRNIENFVVLAVSDGAGSKKFSRIGAKASCEGAMHYLEKELRGLLRKNRALKVDLSQNMQSSRFQQAASQMAKIVQEAVLAARQNVISAYEERRGSRSYADAVKRDLQLNDFAATLLLTLAMPVDGSDEIFVATCQVGDGMTVAMNRQAAYEQMVTLLGDADSGAFAGETEFLTSSSIDSLQSLMGRTRVARKKIDIIMSMTDGVADDYEPNGKEMFRLYLDLLVNRVIASPEMDCLLKHMDKMKRMDLEKSVPAPQSYPAVSGDEVPKMVPVQYVKELCEKHNIDLKTLWEEHKDQLAVMSGTIEMDRGKSPASRLKEWLDNYVVRGSFDDRTLVILQRGEQDGEKEPAY